MAFEEVQRYGLSVREGEVWVLHRKGYTYKDIAQKLNITPNTVKKHMKSILIKPRNTGP
jgi:DNA-binding CsgD family transcriptional regulator